MLLQVMAEYCNMDAVSSEVDNRAGKTFEVELYIPWDAPEAVVDVSSSGVTPLRNLSDVIGLVGRRDNATESRILQGRDPRSIRVLVPDCRGLDQNFHDVTIVDMGDLPESHVSMPELAELIHKWPPAVINHMTWRQRELEQRRKAAKREYRQKHPAPCTFCGTIIKTDMYLRVCPVVAMHVCPVVAMPRVVVHCLEGDTTRLDGPYTRRSQCAGGDQEGQPGNAFSSVDSHTPAVCRVPDSSTFRHFERCASVQRRGVVAGSSLPRAQNRPAACCISWKIFGAAACSPTGEHDPVDSGRAIRRCLFAGAIDGTPDGCFASHASSTCTSPTAGTDHGYACTNCASTYGTGPMDGGRSRGV